MTKRIFIGLLVGIMTLATVSCDEGETKTKTNTDDSFKEINVVEADVKPIEYNDGWGHTITENIITEQILTETVLTETTIVETTTVYISPEYQAELEFNSQKNVYFGHEAE